MSADYAGRVYAFVKEHGCELTREPEQIIIDAPGRKVWAATLTHGMYAGWNRGFKSPDWKDLWERVSMGLTDCEEPDCEICEDMEAE